MTILEPEVADLPTPNGPMRTTVYRPASPGRYPGIVLYSEIFQVTAPIRRTAAFLAGHGFIVAVRSRGDAEVENRDADKR